MDHHPHIVLVDAHPESIGGHHDPAFLPDPGILLLVPGFLQQAGMVVIGADLVLFQEFGNELGLPSVAHINDAAPLHLVQYLKQPAGFVFFLDHEVIQVFTVKTCPDKMLLFELQLLLDVFHHFGSCRCRKC